MRRRREDPQETTALLRPLIPRSEDTCSVPMPPAQPVTASAPKPKADDAAEPMLHPDVVIFTVALFNPETPEGRRRILAFAEMYPHYLTALSDDRRYDFTEEDLKHTKATPKVDHEGKPYLPRAVLYPGLREHIEVRTRISKAIQDLLQHYPFWLERDITFPRYRAKHFSRDYFVLRQLRLLGSGPVDLDRDAEALKFALSSFTQPGRPYAWSFGVSMGNLYSSIETLCRITPVLVEGSIALAPLVLSLIYSKMLLDTYFFILFVLLLLGSLVFAAVGLHFIAKTVDWDLIARFRNENGLMDYMCYNIKLWTDCMRSPSPRPLSEHHESLSVFADCLNSGVAFFAPRNADALPSLQYATSPQSLPKGSSLRFSRCFNDDIPVFVAPDRSCRR